MKEILMAGQRVENTLAVAGVTILTGGMWDGLKIDGGMRDEQQRIT